MNMEFHLIENKENETLYHNWNIELTSRINRRAIIGGAAYPSPSKMASIDRWKPPIESIPVIEHIKLPATAMAPYIPKIAYSLKVMLGKSNRDIQINRNI